MGLFARLAGWSGVLLGMGLAGCTLRPGEQLAFAETRSPGWISNSSRPFYAPSPSRRYWPDDAYRSGYQDGYRDRCIRTRRGSPIIRELGWYHRKTERVC